MKEIIRAIKWYSLKYFQLTEKRKKFNKAQSLSKHNLSCLKYFFGLKSFSDINYFLLDNHKFKIVLFVTMTSNSFRNDRMSESKVKIIMKTRIAYIKDKI